MNLFLPWRIGNMNGVYVAESQDKILVFQDPQAHPDAIAFAVHAANCHNDLVEALATLVEWANPNASEWFEYWSDAFLREHGYYPPGRSMPLEMSSAAPSDETRAATWCSWIRIKQQEAYGFGLAALAKAKGGKPMKCDICGSDSVVCTDEADGEVR